MLKIRGGITLCPLTYKETDMDNVYYYCYSTRLYHFLSSLKFRYVSDGVNKSTNKKYWVYQKSPDLDSAIADYNSIKHKYN